MTKILLADNVDNEKAILPILDGYDVTSLTTYASAQTVLTNDTRIDLILIAVHFDHSQSVDLVRLVRNVPTRVYTPIIIYQCYPSNLASFLRDTVMAMSKFYSIHSYIDLQDKSSAAHTLKSAVDDCLSQRQIID